jgi:eukaryotic-like serine/threonine-protein kinase
VSIAALVALIEVLQHAVQPGAATIFRDPLVRLSLLAFALGAVGIGALWRYASLPTALLMRCALALGAIGGGAIAFMETTPGASPPLFGLSGLGLWIVLFGVLVPYQPVMVLVAGLVAASAWPAAYVINLQRYQFPPALWTQLVTWVGLNYVMAGLAYLIATRTQRATTVARAVDDLGSYHLVSPLGEGGMGEVWTASHQMLARKAAIKLVKPRTKLSEREADMWVKRFRREANVIAGLQSPHTIYLYDFGVSQSGEFYYVMELLDGISLQTLVTTFGPQPAARVRTILHQVCMSLEEAHQQGLVHRDLKPSNVMLCKVALTYDFVKVLDFGLAKCAACEDVTQLTMEGTTAGTPGYMAPEVTLGEPIVDGRADLYALGCVAYFLLTGTLVFPDANPMSMALKHVQAVPDRPSSRTELPIPEDLERIVMQCLEKTPACRPASAGLVANWLSKVELPEWTHDDALRWWDRHLPPTSTLRSAPGIIGDTTQRMRIRA